MKILLLGNSGPPPGGLRFDGLKELGHTVFEPLLPEHDLIAALRTAENEAHRVQPDLIFGYGWGAAVAMNLRGVDVPLVLLSPAWKRCGAATKVKQSTVLLHATTDECVPLRDTIELVNNSKLSIDSLTRLGQDHPLTDPAALGRMLEAVASRPHSRNFGVRPAGVPRRFGLGVVFLLTAMGAVLFSTLRLFSAPPEAILVIAAFFVVVWFGQAFLFKGSEPRYASIVAGACFMSILVIGASVYERIVKGASLLSPSDAIMAFLFGALFGYLAGLLIAGVFLVLELVQSGFRRAASVRPNR